MRRRVPESATAQGRRGACGAAEFACTGELRGGLIVGQLPASDEDVEQFGIVLAKGSSLTRCVSSVVDVLRSDGTLSRLEHDWLADAGKAPLLS